MVLAGASRLYVTGRSWYAPRNYDNSARSLDLTGTNHDTFQLFVFDYVDGTTFLNHYSKGNSQFGYGTGSSFVDINRSTATVNGAEAVLMGGGHASDSSAQQWVLGLYSIDAVTGEISANGLKYQAG
jgi:hypothetical protein